MNWKLEANCLGTDPDLFHEPEKIIGRKRSRGSGRITQAKRVCAACPVRVQCLEYALEIEDEYAIMGGLTPDERSRIDCAA